MQKTLGFGSITQSSHHENSAMIIEKKKPKHSLPWVEKYRPKQIEDLSYQEEIVKSMAGILKTGNLPHLLLYGPPGTGKTSSILALARQLFGPEMYRKRILELNASDDRGIAKVREKIKKFSQMEVVKVELNGKTCPKYKIAILDEADLMTTDAQHALRRIIEDNSARTRFCIICNYITKIIEPLASRCVKFRFNGIPKDAQILKLKEILMAEDVLFNESVLEDLVEMSGGDLRRSITLMQTTSALHDKDIKKANIYDLSGAVPKTIIQHILTSLRTLQAKDLEQEAETIIADGYSPEVLLNQLQNEIIFNTKLGFSQFKIARILEKIACTEKSLTQGGSDFLQLFNLFISVYQIIHQPDF